MELFQITKNKYYRIAMVLIVLTVFYNRIKDDSYSKKVAALEFVNFYSASINGVIDYKRFYGRGGNYFSIQGDEKSYHIKTEKNINTQKYFYDSISIGSLIEKKPYSGDICIIFKKKQKECFTYMIK